MRFFAHEAVELGRNVLVMTIVTSYRILYERASCQKSGYRCR